MPVAAIGAGLGLAGSIIGAKAQKSAANKAADTSLAVASQNNALARDIYGQNAARLDPYSQTGLSANNALAALYGLGGSQPTQQPAQQQYQGYGGSPYGGQPNGMQYMAGPDIFGGGPIGLQQYFPQMQTGGGYVSGIGDGIPGNTPASAVNPQQTQENAFQTFRDSTGYQFQLDEAHRGINSGYAANGLLQSGAAMKALQDRSQSIADNSFQSYASGLGSLANRGAGAASSIAGVGQNFVSNVTANNNAAGTAAANAQLARGNISANMWGGIGNALGQGLGGLFGGSSYGK